MLTNRMPTRVSVRQNGYAIRAIRVMRGYSGIEFAALLEISPDHLLKVERENSKPSTLLIEEIARHLAVPLPALLREPLEVVEKAGG
jgi:transcriptional regulator with XRE-family HTH domain